MTTDSKKVRQITDDLSSYRKREQISVLEFDPQELNCELYEIKYSKEVVAEQYRHLVDEEKCAMTAKRYGDITGKYVIYRGKKNIRRD